MSFKQFALDERTTVTIYKRKKSRSLRLSLTHDGQIRVSIPVWAPYSAGLQFANSRLEWIHAQRRQPQALAQGQPVGKAHHLRFLPTTNDRVRARASASEIIVSYPETSTIDQPEVQKVATDACVRALRAQAEKLLPQRLATLAAQYEFDYAAVRIKQLKSRWGSCDQQANITLSLYLMQLPWDCIDYVLLHELTHTKILQHGPIFWEAMATVCPQLSEVRKRMRGYQPVLQNPFMTATD